MTLDETKDPSEKLDNDTEEGEPPAKRSILNEDDELDDRDTELEPEETQTIGHQRGETHLARREIDPTETSRRHRWTATT